MPNRVFQVPQLHSGRTLVTERPVAPRDERIAPRPAPRSQQTRSPSVGVTAGILAPHPPHLVYAENPPQNEPKAQGGWDSLRWAYIELRKRIEERGKPDVFIIHAPHWITAVGHHVNCTPNPKGVSVEPIFPNIFRYKFDFRTDVELAEAIADSASDAGLLTSKMRDPDVRVDYATIGGLHLVNPDWDVPVVSISAHNNPYFFADSPLDEMEVLGEATRKAVGGLGRNAILLASNSLSHRHFDTEPELPEDMSLERPFNGDQYAWDMKFLEVVRTKGTRAVRDFMPGFIDATAAEIKAGGLSWMLAGLGWPDTTGEVFGYGTVIGTGNAVIEWRPEGIND